MNPSTRRLFFALWPSDELRHELAARAINWVRPFQCRPVPTANFHVTLAFLGAVPSARVAQLGAIGRRLSLDECAIEFARIAVWRNARVLALVADEIPQALAELVTSLRRSLATHAYSVEDRPYRAHVTLARDVPASSHEETIAPIEWPVKGFVLVESTVDSRGSRYDVIARFP